MMRFARILFWGMVLVGLMAGAASAGTLALTADQSATVVVLNQTAVEPTYYPAEAVVPATVKIFFTTGGLDAATMPAAVALVGAAVPKSITYIPTTNLPSGTRIVFTLTNGKWADATYYLMKQQGAAFPANSDGVTVATADSISNNVMTFIVGSTPIDAGTIMILSSTQDATPDDSQMNATNVKITMDAVLATALTKVSLAVTDCFDAVGPIVGGLANSINLVGSYQQFTWTRVVGAGTINVETPDLRRFFLGSAVTPATAGSLLLKDNQAAADVDSGLAGNQVANFAVNLNTAALATLDYTVTGVQLQKLVPTTGLRLLGSGATSKNFTWGTSDTTATLSFATNVPATTEFYDGTTETVIFTVNGTSTLDVQTFTVVANLNFADNTKYNDVPLASGNIMVWAINGYQAVVPYITTDPAFATICIANNTSVSSADLVVDILSSESGTVATNLGVGTIGSKKTVRLDFNGLTVTNAAGGSNTIPLGAGQRYSVRFTITADQNSVYVNCIQIDPAGSKRMVPVLTNELNINWRQ